MGFLTVISMIIWVLTGRHETHAFGDNRLSFGESASEYILLVQGLSGLANICFFFKNLFLFFPFTI